MPCVFATDRIISASNSASRNASSKSRCCSFSMAAFSQNDVHGDCMMLFICDCVMIFILLATDGLCDALAQRVLPVGKTIIIQIATIDITLSLRDVAVARFFPHAHNRSVIALEPRIAACRLVNAQGVVVGVEVELVAHAVVVGVRGDAGKVLGDYRNVAIIKKDILNCDFARVHFTLQSVNAGYRRRGSASVHAPG